MGIRPSWHDISSTGAFQRLPAQFRCTEALPSPSPGRYHLIVSLACPWSHRTAIMRSLKGLESAVPMDIVHPYLSSAGWEFRESYVNSINDYTHLSQFYKATDPQYSGRITVPVLYDTVSQRIVCNESSEILQIFNRDFQSLALRPDVNIYPDSNKELLDEMCGWMYDKFNNAVYRAGFAKSQAAYDTAVADVFQSLDKMDKILANNDYLASIDNVTVADLYSYPTLFRFDVIYAIHFKCCRRRVTDYHHVWRYLRKLYNTPEFNASSDLVQCMQHYYTSHTDINPHGIVPVMPQLDWSL